jgi:hypothetical protein
MPVDLTNDFEAIVQEELRKAFDALNIELQIEAVNMGNRPQGGIKVYQNPWKCGFICKNRACPS